MQKILVYSDSLEKSADMRRMFESLPYQLHLTHDFMSLVNQNENKVFVLTVIDQRMMEDKILNVADDLRRSGYAFPILVLTEKVTAAQTNRLNGLHDVHLLERPIHDKNLMGLIRKLLVTRRVPRQNYRRFNTNQLAQVETISSGESLLTSMYNLSKGGAYCEFDGSKPVCVGEIFRLKVYLHDTKSEYTFNAKVVWTTPKGRFSGRAGCGFKFLVG